MPTAETLQKQLEAMLLREIEQFKHMTLEQWLAMDAGSRSMLAGAIAGNYGTHHAAECFTLLQSLFRGETETDAQSKPSARKQ